MRTLIVGLFGGLLVFAYFFYKGDTAPIRIFGLEITAPGGEEFFKKLEELQQDRRAIGGSFLPDVNLVRAETAPEYYAGMLIAKPRVADVSALSADEAVAVSSTAVVEAMVEAAEIGDVDSGPGETLIINVDFDLRPQIVAPESLPLDAVQPLSFRADAVSRRDARRAERRALLDRDVECTDPREALNDPGLAMTCAIQRLRDSGKFEYVEKNYIVTTELSGGGEPLVGAPSDPLYGFQWHFRNQGDGADESPGGASFNAFWSQARQTGSRDIVVAVIDTGIDSSHPDIDLAQPDRPGSGNVAPGVDMVSVPFYGNDGDGRDLDPTDPGDQCDLNDPLQSDSFHGTHVAGTIGAAATNNGDGVAAGAWNVTIVPVRALGRCGGLQSDITEAILWAAGVQPTLIETEDGSTLLYQNPNPADIINMSLGFRAPSGCPRSVQEAINRATEAGAIVVAAAGNASIDVAGYGPSGCDNVVTVAAGDAVGALTSYSNYGEGVDIMAPGGDMRKDLNNDGRPDGVLSLKRTENCFDPVENSDGVAECFYAYENGTSMAAPHVSAALALLKAEYPNRSNASLIRLITDTARSPRTLDQCMGPCDDTPGGVPIDGQPGQCFRPCGSGLMDLAKALD